MIFQIERLGFEELRSFLRLQAEDAFPDLKNEKRLNMLAEKWSNNAECSTCRDEENNLIGMIAFYANGQCADFAYIPHVYVSPEYRNQGLFVRMLGAVEQSVKQKGFREIRLEVDVNNTAAIKSYQKNGFEFIKEQMKNEKSYHMNKSLSYFNK